MKRLFIILIASLLLVGCGNDVKENDVHENINESLAADSKAILELATSIAEEERSLTESEERTFEKYAEKYSASSKLKTIDLSGEDIALFVVTEQLISSAKSAKHDTDLPSDKNLFEYRVERFEKVLKTGEMISEEELEELLDGD